MKMRPKCQQCGDYHWKKIAKLRLDDKKGAAQEQLEALERIGKAVGFDLFDWGRTQH